MEKNEHIKYWLTTSEIDWETVESLFSSGKYLHSLYFAHISLEKLCKAFWVRDNQSNVPPKIHNLVKILSETTIKVNDEIKMFLHEFNDFQLEGRYPDYQLKIYKTCDKEYTKKLLDNIEIIKRCLIDQI